MPTAAQIAEQAAQWTRPPTHRAPPADLAPFLPTAEKLHFIDGWLIKAIATQFITTGLWAKDNPRDRDRLYWRLAHHLNCVRKHPPRATHPDVQTHLESLQNLSSPG